jgi:hypothetical protein
LRPTQKPAPVMTWPDRLKDWMVERDLWKPVSDRSSSGSR